MVMGTSVKHLYEFGPFQLDPPERLLLCDGQPVPMTPKAFDLLVVLVERGGHLVEKDELLKTVWRGSIVEEGNLSVTVSFLRKALNDDRGLHKYIETVSKRGYRFVADVRQVGEPRKRAAPAAAGRVSGEPEKQRMVQEQLSAAVPKPATIAPRGIFRWSILAAALGLGALLILVKVVPRRRERSRAKSKEPVAIRSLAVLPFQTLGAKRGDEYLGLGMADALITRLGNTGKIIVRPTSAIQKYAGSGSEPTGSWSGARRRCRSRRTHSTRGRSRSSDRTTHPRARRRATLG